MFYGGEKMEQNKGRGDRILTPNELDVIFLIPNYSAYCKVSLRHAARGLVVTCGI